MQRCFSDGFDRHLEKDGSGLMSATLALGKKEREGEGMVLRRFSVLSDTHNTTTSSMMMMRILVD